MWSPNTRKGDLQKVAANGICRIKRNFFKIEVLKHKQVKPRLLVGSFFISFLGFEDGYTRSAAHDLAQAAVLGPVSAIAIVVLRPFLLQGRWPSRLLVAGLSMIAIRSLLVAFAFAIDL